MLPSAYGLGQHFQDLGHSFSLYRPLSRQITYISLYQLFVPRFAMAVFLCIHLYYRIHKQRDTSFEGLRIILNSLDR